MLAYTVSFIFSCPTVIRKDFAWCQCSLLAYLLRFANNRTILYCVCCTQTRAIRAQSFRNIIAVVSVLDYIFAALRLWRWGWRRACCSISITVIRNRRTDRQTSILSANVRVADHIFPIICAVARRHAEVIHNFIAGISIFDSILWYLYIKIIKKLFINKFLRKFF